MIPHSRNSYTRLVLLFRLGGLAAGLIVIGLITLIWGADSIQARVDSASADPWPGALAFVGLYALATVLLVPGSASTASAGVVYGSVSGSLVAIAGATCGATLSYMISQTVGRGPAASILSKRATEIDSWISDRQFRSIALVRLMPIVPFNLFNYAAGLSSVRLGPYVAGTAVGIIPGAILTASLGSRARQPTSWPFLLSVALVIVATVVSSLAARRWART